MKERKYFFYTVLVLLGALLAIYGHVWQCDFIYFDDDTHVFNNEHVRKGLTAANVVWAFTQFHGSQWIPMTWLSHMADVSLFGLDAGAHHLMAVAVHAFNVTLLLLLLVRLTGRFWESAAVAALFAVHPLNVESVAWIAERKNLLSTTFWFLTTLAYLRYAQEQSIRRYVLVFVLLALGLGTKAMLVTLPCTLLLLDFWPLERWRKENWRSLVLEKIPLFVLVAAISAVTTHAAAAGAALISLDTTPISYRVSNAAANYAIYLGKLLWPANLAALYPLPKAAPVLAACLSALGIVCVLFVAWRLRTKAPYLLFGCLWFLGTLVPVSGIVQLGKQVQADRFVYVPQIGIFIALVWGIGALVCQYPRRIQFAAAVGTVILVGLSIRSALYVQQWTDTASLFSYTAAVTENNSLAHGYAGYAFARKDDLRNALRHYRAALAIDPRDATVRANLGVALSRLGDEELALGQFRQALEDDPTDFGARLNLATHLLKKKQATEAIEQLNILAEAREKQYLVHYWLGRAWADVGHPERAAVYYRNALEASPDDKKTQDALAQLEREAAQR